MNDSDRIARSRQTRIRVDTGAGAGDLAGRHAVASASDGPSTEADAGGSVAAPGHPRTELRTVRVSRKIRRLTVPSSTIIAAVPPSTCTLEGR